MNAIGVCVDGTFIPPRDGASERFASLPRELAVAGSDVVVFHCSRGWSDIAAIAEQPFITYVLPPELYYGTGSAMELLVRRHSIGVLQVNDLETVLSVAVPVAQRTRCRIVYEAHYHSSTLAGSLGAPSDTRRELEEMERSVVKYCDRLIVFGVSDQNRWKMSGATEQECAVVPFGVDGVSVQSAGAGTPTIAFLGNMYFEPNERAVHRLLDVILPRVKKLMPLADCVFVGDIPTGLRDRAFSQGVRVLGEVPDIMPVLRTAHLGVAPVTEGTGVRVKILKYLAAGLPVVATRSAAEDLELPAVWIHDDWESFAARCVSLLRGEPGADERVRQTQALLSQNWLWPNIAKQALTVYEQVLAAPSKDLFGVRRRLPSAPMWLAEVIGKGRFRDGTSIPRGFRYGRAGHGKIEWFAGEVV